MVIHRIELTNFRVYENAAFELSNGVTAVVGQNAQGKTSLAEAMSWLSTLRSFRGVPNDVLVRAGCDSAWVRAEITRDDGREVLVEAEINRAGRNRVLVNKQRLQRVRDLLGVVRATVFAPTDLALVYEGPSVRREFMDDALTALSSSFDRTVQELERVVRQRNVLLKQMFGRLTPDTETTLDVWDDKFVEVGTQVGDARARLVAQLAPFVQEAYETLAGEPTPIDLVYEPSWRAPGLAAALAAARSEDVRRGLSTVGPHRDELDLGLKGMPIRSTGSQGECRTLSRALRLAVHRLVTEKVGEAPLLVLDDVLSELDPGRAAALLGHLPPGQVIITTAQP
ncbi:MAG: replication and repair protein RecF, partial [Actinomycetota bacterium]